MGGDARCFVNEMNSSGVPNVRTFGLLQMLLLHLLVVEVLVGEVLEPALKLLVFYSLF